MPPGAFNSKPVGDAPEETRALGKEALRGPKGWGIMSLSNSQTADPRDSRVSGAEYTVAERSPEEQQQRC